MKAPGPLSLCLALAGFAAAGETPSPEAGDGPPTYEPVSPGAIFPVKPGEAVLVPKGEAVTAKVILAKFGKDVPELTLTEVHAEIVDKPGSGPMQATFELKPKLSIKPMISAMTFLPALHTASGWPRDKVAHFVIDEVLADSAPPNFAAAVMIECLLGGIEIPEEVVLFGGIDSGGVISRTADKSRGDTSYFGAIRVAAAAAVPPEPEGDTPRRRPGGLGDRAAGAARTMYLITGPVPDGTLDDLILDEEWATLNSTQVLRCGHFKQAIQFIRAISGGSELGESITGLAEAQEVLRRRSVGMLSDADVWARVAAAGRASEANATAFAYARLRARKVSRTYSLDRCVGGIDAGIDKVVGQAYGLSKLDDRGLRRYVREVEDGLEALGRKVHPDAKELYDSALVYLDAAADKIKARRKVGLDGELPERVSERFKAAADTYSGLLEAARAKLSP